MRDVEMVCLLRGVVDEVTKLPAFVALVGGEVIYEGYYRLLVGGKVQVPEQLLRVLVQVGSHGEADLAVHGHFVGHAGVAIGGEVDNFEGHHGHGMHENVLLPQEHGQHPRVVVPTGQNTLSSIVETSVPVLLGITSGSCLPLSRMGRVIPLLTDPLGNRESTKSRY
jgi:hypothetical protein